MNATLVDPCSCTARCPCGEQCLGGHANTPDRHWYSCEVCSPSMARTYQLAFPVGQYIGVLVGCGHAVGPDPLSAISRAMVEHRQTCTAAVAPTHR